MKRALLLAVLAAACGGSSKSSNAPAATGTGIDECDQYISLQRSCSSRLPEGDPTRANLAREADKMESDLRGTGFHTLADSDPDKKEMRGICAGFLESQGRALADCKF